MQFHIGPTPHQRRIRRIPTIRLQTMKHIQGNCMRNCWAGRDMPPPPPRNLARNSIGRSFNRVRKRCNSTDLNSMFEIVAGELRAKLLGGGGAWPGYSQRPGTTSVKGAGGTGGPGRAIHSAPAPPVWRAPEGPEGTGGLRGAAPNEVRSPSLAGGRALRRPEHPWGNKQPSNANARQPKRAAARSHSQWSTQRSRAATTSATWTAFRAAPLRRLSPETTRTRPRLPSTA